MTSDEMLNNESDLYSLATKEDKAVVDCPCCRVKYWVRGGYMPYYTTGRSEADL